MSPTSPSRFDELLALLGRLNYAWTNTESVLIHVIAGLVKTDKSTATIIFLTLNTTRARLNLVERLAKAHGIKTELRDRVLDISKRLAKVLAMKNRFNHCIYAFDTSDGSARAIQMRVQDQATATRYGKAQDVNAETIKSVKEAIQTIGRLNEELWDLIRANHYPI